jgi:hypothetical protein
MNRAFGVRVTRTDGASPRVVPLVVVALDEREAEMIACAAAGDCADAETLRALTETEARNYGLDLSRHGDVKALPELHL